MRDTHDKVVHNKVHLWIGACVRYACLRIKGDNAGASTEHKPELKSKSKSKSKPSPRVTPSPSLRTHQSEAIARYAIKSR